MTDAKRAPRHLQPVRPPLLARPARRHASRAGELLRRHRALAVLAFVVVSAAACAPAPRASALLITLDTLRADAVGARTAQGEPITPFLDRLRDESIVFDYAHTVAPQTQPAHASMLTGLAPPVHGIRINGLRPLAEEYETLAESARTAGRRTAAFVAAHVLQRGTGLAQGFEHYDEPAGAPVPGSHSVGGRRANEVVSAALAWLGTLAEDESFFVWIHLFDAHFPYDAPSAGLPTGTSDYLREVAFLDRELARLYAALEERRLLERCTLLVVGDHGESLGAHDEDTHGILVYEPVLRVPFLVRPAGPRASGRVDMTPVSVVDVYPTVARVLGIDVAPPGASADVLGRLSPERGSYFESMAGYLDYGWSPIVGWVDARAKYVHSSAPELYRLDVDPNETNDLAAREDVAPYLRRLRDLELAEPVRGPRAFEPSEIDEQTWAALGALGYATGQRDAELPSVLDVTDDLPSPADRTSERRRTMLAQGLVVLGRHEEALVDLRALTTENPENLPALQSLITCLLALERREEAIPFFTRAMALTRPTGTDLYNFAACLFSVGRDDEALYHLMRAVDTSTTPPPWLGRFVEKARERGFKKMASEGLRRARRD